MSRYAVQADFITVPPGEVTGDMITSLLAQLVLHGMGNGDAYARPLGWTGIVFVGSPGFEEACCDGTDIIRKAASDAGVPLSAMTDIHVRRADGFVLRPAHNT
jgi:hypothetical protein